MEIILGTPNGTPSYVGQVDSCFGLFGESVFLGARKVHSLRRMYHRLKNHFGRTRWYY
jgi:hypothetical protein